MKRVMKIHIFILLSVAFCSSLSAELFIRMYPSCTTTDAKISLGMIADISGTSLSVKEKKELSGIILGKTPDFGMNSYISKFDVLRSLRKLDKDYDVEFIGPLKSTISRPEKIISREDIRDTILKYLHEEGIYNPINQEISFASKIRDLTVPEDYQLKLNFVQGNRYQGGAVSIRFFHKDTQVVELKVKVKLYDVSAVVIAKENIKRGTVIDAGMIGLEMTSSKNSTYNSFNNQRDLIGKVARINIPKGGIIKNNNIKKNIVIFKGDILNLTAALKAMTIRTSVKALENGAPGDHIKVKNTRSGKKISVVVINSENVSLGGEAA